MQQVNGKIIPFGYANGGMPLLEHLMSERSAYLVDIRLSPRSQWHVWNKEALQARFPKRYTHIPELGNVNYNNDQPIQIANAEQGITRLINGIKQGYTIVLLCGCKQYALCHRRTVVNLLLTALPEVEVEIEDEVKL